ncbi:MAG TPA: ATP-binding protein [Thermoanaerobaculia bacterium]|nr:ATP-binding protein [Thermoanaerobaculia bacterium]
MSIEELVTELNPWWEDATARVARSLPARRDLQPKLVEHLLHLSDRRAWAIAGPRQVGKTVMLRQTIDDLLDRDWPPSNITYFDFSDARMTEGVLPNVITDVVPSWVREDLPRVLLFDEISRAINWDLWLKNVVDRGGFRVAVTDSSASLLRTGTRESGQGRWDEVKLEGLSFLEAIGFIASEGEEPRETLQRRPDLFDRYVKAGGYPAYLQIDDLDFVRRELREHVGDRAVVRDLVRSGVDVERARALFVFLVQESGTIFKVGERARQLSADTRSVHDWLRLLEEAALVSRLPRFAVRPSRRMLGDPKIYASEHGLIWALSLPSARPAEVLAKVYEAVVFRHLREIARVWGRSLSYFRRRNDLEIDFVLELPSKRIAVEVTSQRAVSESRIDRVRKAAQELGADSSIVIFGGITRAHRDAVGVLPLVEFLIDPAGAIGVEDS